MERRALGGGGPTGREAFAVHQIVQSENGIYIHKNMYTRELAAGGAHDFLSVLGHARVKGTVQMIMNPIAMR
jgi:hypothetical protein